MFKLLGGRVKKPAMGDQEAAGIIARTLSSGASQAGLVRAGRLEGSPSHEAERVVTRPDNEGTVLVLGLVHPKNEPILDWWDGRKGTEGNRRLIAIGAKVVSWLREELGVEAQDLPYRADRGGVFLKDAAALAGLGIIGRNNLFLSPDFGARLRLRGVLIRAQLPDSPGSDFDPCGECPAPCLQVCPQEALDEKGYNRSACKVQMDWDMDHAVPVEDPEPAGPVMQVRYCRACEFACPVGKGV